jgi:hypothetical protein
LVAHPSFEAVPLLAQAALSRLPKPCWTVKQPSRWALAVSRNIPFEAIGTRNGRVAIGYAHDATHAAGIEVSPESGDVRELLGSTAADEIERVTPTADGDLRIIRVNDGSPLRSRVDVPGSSAFSVGVANGGFAITTPEVPAPIPAWSFDGGEDAVSATSVQSLGNVGYAVIFRRRGAVWSGLISANHKPLGQLVKVSGSGGTVGRPAAAFNGREMTIIFADRPNDDASYEIRVGRARAGTPITTTAVWPLPKGGPGGDAFAPSIAGLPDGRWLLVWTEGPAGSRAIRAQTLAPDLAPLGDPIALSPPAGSYGQGTIGTAGGYAAAVFLSKGATSYELWGAVLQCGA